MRRRRPAMKFIDWQYPTVAAASRTAKAVRMRYRRRRPSWVLKSGTVGKERRRSLRMSSSHERNSGRGRETMEATRAAGSGKGGGGGGGCGGD
jgi:hypothetical protein